MTIRHTIGYSIIALSFLGILASFDLFPLGWANTQWQALQPQGQATLIGALIGFLGGSVINNHLAGKREAKKSEEAKRSLAAAFLSELQNIWLERVDVYMTSYSASVAARMRKVDYLRPAHRLSTKVFDSNADQIGTLGMSLCAALIRLYGLADRVNSAMANPKQVTPGSPEEIELVELFEGLEDRIWRRQTDLAKIIGVEGEQQKNEFWTNATLRSRCHQYGLKHPRDPGSIY